MSTFKKLKDTFKEIGTLGYADTETYNPNEVLKKKQEDALGVSFAPKKVSTAPTIDKKQPEYFMPGDNFSTVPGQDLIMKFGEGSTVSRAYLDAASPKLTSSQDDIRDLQKNNDTIKNLAAQGQLTPEDTQQMLDQQKQGMSRADILGRMVSKKRYQLGTRAYAQETKLVDSSGKAEPLINKTNLTSLYAPSEIDSYLATKPEIGPEAIDFYKQKKAGGMTGDQIKQDIALNFIQKDIEDEMYDKKDFIEKAFSNVGQTAAATGIDLVASVPHIAAFIANIPAMVSEADLTAETGLGESINKWTNAKVSGEFKGMGMDTGEVSGDANNNIMAGQVVSTLIGLVYGSSFVKGLTKLPVIAKFPKLAGAINMIVDGGKALEKGAPLSAKTINVLQRLGASAIRNGLFTVGASAMLEGKGPTNTQLALGTALGVAGEGAFIAGGKGLEAIGAKVGLSGLFSTKASMGRVKTILSDAYSDEGLKAADIDETFINNWLKAHTRGGEKADMIKDIKQFATGKSADMVTDVMDGMSNGAAIIKDTKGDIAGAIEKLIAKTSKGKSADDKLLTKQLEGMLKRIDAEGGIGATEANTVKRLIAERLHPFKQRGIGEPQNLDDAALYNTIKKELEDVADGLGIDIRAVNKEVIEANVISSVLEKEMLKDSMANMSFGDFTKWGAKQAFVKGIQSQFGPFDEDTVTGRISNIAFWQTASVLTKIPGFALDKTVGLQTFKNWLSRTLTKFSPAEKGALEKFWQDGKAGKFNRTWSEFAQENPAAASASDKMSEALSLFAKENNIELTDGLTDTMIGPKTGKPTTPVDVTLPGGEPSVPAGTAFPAIYDNTISARTSINGSNPNLAASLQEPQLPGSQLSQNGMPPTTGLQGTPGQPGDIAPGQESTGGYVDFSKGTTGANVTEVTPLVNPTPGTSLASTYERGFTLKNGKIDKEFGVKEMLADYKKLSPEEQAVAREIYSLKNIIEASDINTEANEIEIISHPLTDTEALELYKPIIDKVRKGAYTPKELIFINKNAPKSIQNELKSAGNELLGRKPVAPEAKGVKPTETKELPKKVLDIEDEIGMLEDNMGDRSTFVQKYDGADEYGPAGDAYDAVKDMDRFEFEDYDSLWKDKQGGGMVPRNETASKIIDGVDAFANKLGISSDDAIQIVRDGTGGSRYKENLANFRTKYGVAPYQARKALAKFKKDFEAGKNPSIDDFLYKKDNTVDFNRKSKEEMDIENSKTPFDTEDLTPEKKSGIVDDMGTKTLEQEAKKYKSAEEFVKAQGTPVYHGSNKKFESVDDIDFKDGFYTLRSTDERMASQRKYLEDPSNLRITKLSVIKENKLLSQSEIKELELMPQWEKTDKQLTRHKELTLKAGMERNKREGITTQSELEKYLKDPATAFGKEVTEFVADFKNPLIIDFNGKGWRESGTLFDKTTEQIKNAKKNGHDGVIIKNISEGFTFGADRSAGLVDDYIVLDKSALKTKQQLLDIYNKANKSSLPMSAKSEVKYSTDLASEAKKYKSAEEFIKNVDVGGVVIDTSKIDKMAKSGVKNFKASDILSERGIKEMKDLGLDDADISFIDDLKSTTFAGAVHHGGSAPPYVGIRNPIGIEKSNIAQWLKDNKKPGQSIEDFYSQKLDSTILQELTHIRQLQLGRVDIEKIGKYNAPVEKPYFDYKNQKHEMTADKSENFRYKRILTDIYNKANKK